MSSTQRYKLSASRIIGTVGACSMLSLAIGMGGSAGFIDLPSALLTFGLCFFLLLISFGKDYLRFIPASFVCLVASPLQPNLRFAEIAAFGSRFVIGGGAVAALIGTTQMLLNLSDPSSIGQGMATALIPPFYALLASELFFAVVSKSFAEPTGPGSKPLPTRNIAIPLAVVGFIIGTFCIMITAFTNVVTQEQVQQINESGYISQ